MKKNILIAASLLLLSLPAYSLDIVTNIKPLQLITLALVAPEDEVSYIIPPQASPHTYRVKPSAVKRIEKADLVIWTRMETNWHKVFSASDSSLELLSALGLEAEAEEGEEEEHEHNHDHSEDPHIWLSFELTAQSASLISARLSERNPARAAVYEKKRAQFHHSLAATRRAIEKKLKSSRHKKFYTMHDAYGYFTSEFGLAAAGSISLSSDIPLSAKHLNQVLSAIETGQIVCVFAEPQMNPAPILKLIRETPVQYGILDPLATDIEENEDGYLNFLQDLADSFKQCLESSPSR